MSRRTEYGQIRRRGRIRAGLLATSMLASVAALTPPAARAAETLPPVRVAGEALRIMETTGAISREEIDREQPLTLRDLFRNDPAVTVPSGSTAAQKIYVHGIDQNKLNVTVDGAPQRNNVWHHNGNLTLDPIFLKSATVEAGVAPADAGFGALAGAVHFTTKDARDLLLPGQTAGGTVILGYDTNPGTWRTTAAGYAAAQGFEILGMVSRARGDDYKTGAGYEEAGTAANLTAGLAKLAYESDRGHRFEVSGEVVNDEGIRRLRPNMGLIANPTGRLLNRSEATRTTATLRYRTTQPTDLFDPEISVYYNRNRLERPNDNRRPTAHGAFNADVESIGGTVQNSVAIPAGRLTVGIDAYRDDAFVERFHFATDAEERISGFGGFVQARVAPLDRLRLSTGLRLDHQSYRAVDGRTFDNTGLSPNLSAEVDVFGGVTAFAGYSYAWGGLEMAETALYHAGDYTYDPDLKPSRAHNVRGGLRYAEGGLSLEGALFRTVIHDPMAWNYTRLRRINGEDLKTQGFDLSASYSWGHAAVGATYARSDVTYGDRIALPGDYNTGIAVGDLITLRGHYTVESLRLTLGASAELALRLEDEDLRAAGFRDLEPYQVVNLFAEWVPVASMPHWTLRAEANNLFDEAYASRSTYGQTAVIQPVLSEGRSFYLASTLKF
ncbi:TonB-dependent receptor domain-containing protein [Azospirillum halopraeferens]|uniref:TonB-dependent receptor domain-containing protein n=1 Tax=Azospirillum halopraeferens TaxID=34010 RepID=UPI000A06A06C|nr:TonB-dependent receptor [Azospirillum halopraeferens]